LGGGDGHPDIPHSQPLGSGCAALRVDPRPLHSQQSEVRRHRSVLDEEPAVPTPQIDFQRTRAAEQRDGIYRRNELFKIQQHPSASSSSSP
ncbi:hypothetical protein RZS08_48105, partial [Arthrospira platensis SPKY1]|nr:hypothetical protein [Arthrospira platensis SPKY1]